MKTVLLDNWQNLLLDMSTLKLLFNGTWTKKVLDIGVGKEIGIVPIFFLPILCSSGFHVINVGISDIELIYIHDSFFFRLIVIHFFQTFWSFFFQETGIWEWLVKILKILDFLKTFILCFAFHYNIGLNLYWGSKNIYVFFRPYFWALQTKI